MFSYGILYDILLDGFALGCIYALIALGYTMVYGVIKLINFAHGEFFMLGAYVGYFALGYLQTPSPAANFLIAITLATLASALLAVVVEKVAYKPLRNASRIATLLTALGMSLLLQNLAVQFFGVEARPMHHPADDRFINLAEVPAGEPVESTVYYRASRPTTGGKILAPVEEVLFSAGHVPDKAELQRAASEVRLAYVKQPVSETFTRTTILVTVVLLTIGLELIVRCTRMGKAMRAVSYDRNTASLQGINPDRVISFTFFVGAALAGAGGVLVGTYYGQIKPLIGVSYGLKAFIAAVLGGIGSISGAVVGGLILGMAENFAAASPFSSFKDAIALIILIVILFIKPTGIMGRKELKQV